MGPSVSGNLSFEQAAELADVKPAQLFLWLRNGTFKTNSWARHTVTNETTYYFSEADVARLIEFAASQGKRNSKHNSNEQDPFVDDGKQENFTVAQVAPLWRLSRDTIQRLFQDEPGVVALGEKNPRGKRRRVPLRIPRSVMERVKKRRSNPA